MLKKLPILILILMVAAYAVFFSTMTIRQHEGLQTHVFDLGNVDQTIWNTVHGRLLHFTTQPGVGENRLGMHVEPILLLIALSYLVYPDPRGLLVLQTLALALGAVPLYALARRRLGSGWAALAFPLAYLLWPALQAANLFEFHAVALAPFFLLTAFYFMDVATDSNENGVKKYAWLWYAIAVFLALCCKEDISLIVALLGAYIAVVRRRWLAGLLTLGIGLAWFAVTVYVIIPHFRPAGSPFLDFYEGLGNNPASMAWQLLKDPPALWAYLVTPENGLALRALLFPLAGLALFGFPFWLLAGPSLGIYFLSSNPLMHRMERYHYAAPLIAVLAASAVFGVSWLSRTLPGRTSPPAPLHSAEGSKNESGARFYWIWFLALLLVGASVWYHYHRGFTPLAQPFAWPKVTAHDRLIDEVTTSVPPDAVVSIQANLFPHLSQRERAYLWPDPRDKDYIVLDVSDPSFWNRDGAQEQIESDLRHNRQFGWVVARDGYLVLKKGAPVRPLPDSFYSFARVTDPDIQYPMTIDFGDKVRFLGFTPIYEREEEVRYNLYFQALQPLGEDYGVVLYLADAQGNVVGGTDRTQPVPVWYPTSRWQPGETIQVTANTLNWWTGDRDEYVVALGLVKGNDIWDVGARLQPRVRASAWANPLLADGSVAQLMRFRRNWELHEPVEERRAFSPPPMAIHTEAHFGGQADLAGYTLDRTRLQRGEPLALSLYWKAGSAPDRDVPYTAFVHVRDAAGNIVAQQDSMPGDGRLPTTSWMPGEYVTDRHVIPLDRALPPGPYEVALGLYRPDTGARLPVTGTPGAARGDYVVLEQKIDVVE